MHNLHACHADLRVMNWVQNMLDHDLMNVIKLGLAYSLNKEFQLQMLSLNNALDETDIWRLQPRGWAVTIGWYIGLELVLIMLHSSVTLCFCAYL